MKSIRSKLFLTYAALSLLVVILVGLGLTLFVRSFYISAVRERLTEEAYLSGELLKPMIKGHHSDAKREEIDEYLEFLGTKTSARITLILSDGTVAGDSAEDARDMDNHLGRPEIRAAQQQQSGSSIRYSQTVRQEMLYCAVSLQENDATLGYLRLAMPLSQLNTAINRIRYGLLAAMFVVLLLSLGISLPLSASFTRPLRQIAGVAEDISRGNWQSRIYLPNRDEIGAMAASVNKMAESLQEKVKEITQHRDHLEAILSTMVEGVIVFNDAGRAILTNPAAEEMLGIQMGAWKNKSPLELIRNTELQDKIVLVSHDQIYHEHELTVPNSPKRILRVNIVPIRTVKAGKSGVLAVFHDITRLRKLEAMRSEFAANVSHELRTPLTAIQGFAETLLDDAYKDPDAACRFAGIIHREAVRLGTLIEDVLKLAQIESGEVAIQHEPVVVSDLVREITESISVRLEDRKVVLHLSDSLPAVRGDRGLLLQALSNLLDNAVQYTRTDGLITISAELEKHGLLLSVTDNGIGIPAEALDRIFERFYRVDRARSRRQGGTGLGLAIVKHIVEIHQGELRVESTEGSGTTITIVLPVWKPI